MTEHGVLVGYRLRLLTLADELGNVSESCRLMGCTARRTTVGSATSTGGARRLSTCGSAGVRGSRTGLVRIWSSGSSRSRASRFRAPPDQCRAGPGEVGRAADLRISEHGVWRVLCRVGLNTRSKRLALIARHRDPYERAPSPPPPERHIDASVPGEVCKWTASSSAGCPGAKARYGSTPRSTSPPGTRGPSCTPPSATTAPATARRCCTASRTSPPWPAGSSRP